LGAIDIWINNAGIWIPYVPVEELDFARARKLIDVNYFGVAHGTVEALRHMRPNKKGLILSILSVRALQGKPLAAAYCASKFAAEGFSQAVRGEAHKDGVRVVGVYPYRMKTELFGDNKHEDYHLSMAPEDVARIIIDHIEADDPADHLEIWSGSDLRKKVHAVV
jgi:short-subunit dehydrogenase